MPSLDVYLYGAHVAELEMLAPLQYRLTYNAAWLDDPNTMPVSLSLPVGAAPFSGATLTSFPTTCSPTMPTFVSGGRSGQGWPQLSRSSCCAHMAPTWPEPSNSPTRAVIQTRAALAPVNRSAMPRSLRESARSERTTPAGKIRTGIPAISRSAAPRESSRSATPGGAGTSRLAATRPPTFSSPWYVARKRASLSSSSP